MSDFAPSASKLAESGIGVAAAPTGGMGLALTPEGKIPAGALFMGASYQVQIGVATLTWTASATSAILTISHNLGRTPVAMFVTPSGVMGAVRGPALAVGGQTSTEFQVVGADIDGVSRSTTVPIFWALVA